MPNANYRKGTARERQWHGHLEEDGWIVGGSLGSKGVFDRLACKLGDIVLWEVKTDKRGPFASFGPAKRQALIQAAAQAGGSPALCWWPYDRQGPRVFTPHLWPDGEGS